MCSSTAILILIPDSFSSEAHSEKYTQVCEWKNLVLLEAKCMSISNWNRLASIPDFLYKALVCCFVLVFFFI